MPQGDEQLPAAPCPYGSRVMTHQRYSSHGGSRWCQTRASRALALPVQGLEATPRKQLQINRHACAPPCASVHVAESPSRREVDQTCGDQNQWLALAPPPQGY